METANKNTFFCDFHGFYYNILAEKYSQFLRTSHFHVSSLWLCHLIFLLALSVWRCHLFLFHLFWASFTWHQFSNALPGNLKLFHPLDVC